MTLDNKSWPTVWSYYINPTHFLLPSGRKQSQTTHEPDHIAGSAHVPSSQDLLAVLYKQCLDEKHRVSSSRAPQSPPRSPKQVRDWPLTFYSDTKKMPTTHTPQHNLPLWGLVTRLKYTKSTFSFQEIKHSLHFFLTCFKTIIKATYWSYENSYLDFKGILVSSSAGVTQGFSGLGALIQIRIK